MNLAKLVTAHPRILFGAMLLVMVASLPLLLQLQADRSISSFMPRGHISYEQKLKIQQIYNINDLLFVDLYDRQGGDIFTPEGLAQLQEVSRFVEALPGIRPGSVRSLDTHEDILASDMGFDVTPFLEPMPESLPQAQAVRERVRAFPLYDGLLISKDGTRAGIVADFEDSADVLTLFATIQELRAKLEREGRFGIEASGPPIVTGTLNVYMNQDALRLDPVSALLTSILLFIALRTLAGVMLPLAVMLPSVAVAFASMPLFDFHFTPFSNAVPVVILATSIADAVHFLSNYFDRRLQFPQLSAREAVEQTFAEIWRPILITSVTTAAGFLMLIQGSPMIPVDQFGITVAIGVMAAMLFSLTALPAAIVLFDAQPSPAFARLYAARGGDGPSAWDRAVTLLLGRVVDNRAVAALFLLLLVGLGYAGSRLLHADYEPVTFFPEQSDVYQDFYSVRENYVGANFIEVDINRGVVDGIYEPDFLNRLAELQERIEEWEQVGGTLSIADYLKKMYQALNADDPAFYRIADSADANAQLFLLYDLSGDPRRFDEVADGARQRANLRIFLRIGNYANSGEFVHWLEQELADTFPDASVTIGGEAYVIHNWMEGISEEVRLSILLTALVMYLIGSLFLRSLVGGALLLLPIVAGVVLTYAFIGATGVPVGLGTSSFAAIAIGVGIDFAIHYLWRYRDQRRAGLDHLEATRHVMEGVGKTILFNGVIVIVGFSVIMLATTLPPRQVGAYVAITVATSLITTFLVLSVATRWWRVVKE